MVAPAAQKMANCAHDICKGFNVAASNFKDERDQIFNNKPLVQKIAYWASTTFAIGALCAASACVALAILNVSIGFVGYAAVAAVALCVFAYLRDRFDTMTFDEDQARRKFENPLEQDRFRNSLGLIGINDSIPNASKLKGPRTYFESLVVEPKNEKEKKGQEARFALAQKLFDKRIEKQVLKDRIATVALTSLLLESIQHVVAKERKHYQETAARIENGKLIDLCTFADKDRIKVLTAHLKDPSPQFQAALKAAIASEKGKMTFKLADLDTAANLAHAH